MQDELKVTEVFDFEGVTRGNVNAIGETAVVSLPAERNVVGAEGGRATAGIEGDVAEAQVDGFLVQVHAVDTQDIAIQNVNDV